MKVRWSLISAPVSLIDMCIMVLFGSAFIEELLVIILSGILFNKRMPNPPVFPEREYYDVFLSV